MQGSAALASPGGKDSMAAPQSNPLLSELEARTAGLNLRGQWQADPNRPQKVGKGAGGQVQIEPVPAGVPHVWKWREVLPLLRSACEAMKESYTARRALVFTNPALPRGTTQTLLATFQIVPPREIAWAHRHTINALRFSIKGSEKVFTVVDGRALAMEPYDLILTPGWTWHDHHNESDQDAIWMDGLDVPFTLALNQSFFEELGEVAQERRGDDEPSLLRPVGAKMPAARPYRYPWKDAMRAVQAQSRETPDPCHGRVLEYVNPLTGASVLPTISCRIQLLPPGFEGEPFRHTASSIALVIAGEGRTALDDRELEWEQNDSLAIPNWCRHRLINRSKREPAVLFTMTDMPILTAMGFYRSETRDSAAASPSVPMFQLSAAE
jgi:1-hydroxy-2-naphthoate dioxygenase